MEFIFNGNSYRLHDTRDSFGDQAVFLYDSQDKMMAQHFGHNGERIDAYEWAKDEIRRINHYSGEKIKFKIDYNGCFKEFAGKTVTVKERIPCNEGDSRYWYVIKEIPENHLIKSKHFINTFGE